MKIVHILPSLSIGGAEKLVVDLLPLLNKAGCPTDVLVLKNEESYFKTKLQELGINIYFLSEKGTIYNPVYIVKLIRYIKKYDIAHVHLFPTQYWVAFAKILSFSKTKLITTEHSTNTRRRGRVLFRYIDRCVYKRYKKIISVSDHVQKSLLSWLKWNSNECFCVIKNGILLSAFYNAEPIMRKKIGVPDDSAVLLMVSRFNPEKDQPTLIKAMPLLDKNTHLVFVGDGPLKSACIELSKKYNVEHRIHFLGVRTDIAAIIKLADICILSTKWEGLPITAIEYMACGKPVIASAVNGVCEVVDTAGILFPYQDHISLANEIRKLLINKDYYSDIANRVQERAKEYDIENTLKKHVTIYKECVN